MKIVRLTLIVLWIVVTAITGAAAQSATPEVTDEPALSGSTWLLTTTSGQDHVTLVLPGSGITLSFEGENRISGNAGCNGYGGVYTLGTDGEIALSEIISTLRACADNQMTIQESIYLSALSGVTRYEISGHQLALRIDDVETLHFVRADQDPLAGTSWRLIDELPADPDSTPEPDGSDHPITLTFESEGQAVGSGGCNGYSAPYSLNGVNISFGDAASTRMACEGGDTMQREQEFFNALANASQYGLTDDRLYIRYEDSHRLVFERVEAVMLTVAPLSGAPGTEVELTGSGFAPNREIVIGFGPFDGDVYTPIGQAESDADGAFTITVTVPETVDPVVDYVFMAAVPGTARTLSEAFDVTAS
jgi:heat shock protein HslJ